MNRLFKIVAAAVLVVKTITQHDRTRARDAQRARKSQAWRKLVLPGAILIMAAGAGGILLVVSGIVPIKASSEHWPITEWFLDFAKHRSVSTHSMGIRAPHLDETRLVMKGAAHYEIGCSSCHGKPSLRYPWIAKQTTPPPPDLSATVSEWKPAGLFYVVKHGIKFTGMPRWPALERDDEVWAVVAFLRRLPGMDAAEYRRLAHGDAVPAGSGIAPDPLAGRGPTPSWANLCARCHGVDGLGRGEGAFPKLAGQKASYLKASLDAYAYGNRHSGIMRPIAAGLGSEGIAEMADYYAGMSGAGNAVESANVERGRRIALEGIPEQFVPSCNACHGLAVSLGNPRIPDLAGQSPHYLRLQLQLFKEGRRGGTDYAHLMHPVASRLTAEDMWDAALYYASLAN